MQEFDELSNCFESRLRCMRRSWLLSSWGKTVECCILSLLPAFAVQALLAGLVPGRVLLSGLVCWGLYSLVVLIVRRPGLKNYAVLYDRVNGNNSRLLNGYELCRRGGGDSFACWALADSLQSISRDGCRRTYDRISRRSYLLLQLAVIVFSLPLVTSSFSVIGGSSDAVSPGKLAGKAAASVSSASDAGESGAGSLFDFTGDSRGHSAGSGMKHRGGASGALSQGRTAVAGTGGRGAEVGAQEEPSDQGNTSESRFHSVDSSSADSGRSQGDEAFRLTGETESIASDDYSLKTAESARKMRDRSRQTPPVPLSALSLNDKALPAGRDTASDSGEKDDRDPTESPRGDAQGAKNHREIAATLPVLPLVDSINGIFDEGDELRQRVPSVPRSSTFYKRSGRIAPVRREPALSGRMYPREFRKIQDLRKSYE